MADDAVVQRRILQLQRHMSSASQTQASSQLEAAPCAVNRSLPRFDATFMEHYLETDRGLKEEVYDLFRQHPELLYPVEEGMTKGKHNCFVCFFCCCPPSAMLHAAVQSNIENLYANSCG